MRDTLFFNASHRVHFRAVGEQYFCCSLEEKAQKMSPLSMQFVSSLFRSAAILFLIKLNCVTFFSARGFIIAHYSAITIFFFNKLPLLYLLLKTHYLLTGFRLWYKVFHKSLHQYIKALDKLKKNTMLPAAWWFPTCVNWFNLRVFLWGAFCSLNAAHAAQFPYNSVQSFQRHTNDSSASRGKL